MPDGLPRRAPDLCPGGFVAHGRVAGPPPFPTLPTCMDILLVTGRARAGARDPRRTLAARLGADLTGLGHAVRWLCPIAHPEDRPPETAAAVEVIPVQTCPPPFRAVEASVSDHCTEARLSIEIRQRLPDVVHVLTYGGVSSTQTPWVVERLGGTAVVSVDPAELVCHRGTLVDETGAHCDAWARPERCAVCCSVPFDGGLTPGQARLRRLLTWLGPWSPFPGEADFRNRLDVSVGGLAPAARVLVASEEARELLARAGVRAGPVKVVGHGAAELLDCYREASAVSSDDSVVA